MDLLLFTAAHVVAGALIGTRFRFAALLPAFAVVLIESLAGALRFGLAPWYVLLITGLVGLQAGYAAVAYVVPPRQAKHRRDTTGPHERPKETRSPTAAPRPAE